MVDRDDARDQRLDLAQLLRLALGDDALGLTASPIQSMP